MSFDLSAIAVFAAAIGAYWLLPARTRGWALLIGGGATLFLLQPRLPIRFADFVLPTGAVMLTVAGWWWTRAPNQPATRQDVLAVAILAGTVLLLALNRYLPGSARLTPSRPPDMLTLVIGIGASTLALYGVWLLTRRMVSPMARIRPLLLLIVALFALLKTEVLAIAVAGAWRGLAGQDVTIASALDLNWLGFSYLAFRIIHTLIDRTSGILPSLSLHAYAAYALFPPSLVAGPIDRADRFVKDFDALPMLARFDADRFARGGARIAMGIFKKFVIADTLSFGLSLNAVNVDQAVGTGALWLLLYGYALRLFFDFSGYSDIAIGLGIWLGVKLPENFDRPYLRTTITAFWQSWHKSLGDWARFYVFSPLTRAILRRERKPSSAVIVGIGHLATMLTIGLWHGVTVNFAIWGLWQAAGLYAHKRWSDSTRRWYRKLSETPGRKRAWTLFAWAITFHYVALGWVWFALPDVGQSIRALGRLLGIGW
ncbi:MAG: MBOAT family O-acyltransferase [Chloroflexota bacterium]|nr:MBOAT family O-acyltransferase [Chloroflexota bacterium]